MDNKPLTLKQARALPQILAGKNVEDGCKRAGIAKSSFYSWINTSDAFRDAYLAQKEAMLQESLQILEKGMSRACHKIVQHIDSNSEVISLDAARYIVNTNLNLNTINQMIQRIENLTSYLAQEEI